MSGNATVIPSGPRLIEVAGATEISRVPAAHEVLSVIRSTAAATAVSHPVLRLACELAAALRRSDADTVDDVDRIVREIDLWTERHVPQHRLGAIMHTETLGAVIAKIVATSHETDQQPHPETGVAARPQLVTAMLTLTMLCSAYTDLIDEICSGKRRLPTPAPAGGYR